MYDGILATGGLDDARLLLQRLRDRVLAPCPGPHRCAHPALDPRRRNR